MGQDFHRFSSEMNLEKMDYYFFQLVSWVIYGLFKCFLGPDLKVQSLKFNRSFSKNCPELAGKPSKIKFFWSFLLMSAWDCKSRKFNFCNRFIIQQNIFKRSFWIDLGVSANSSIFQPSSRRSRQGTSCFVVESLRRAETSSDACIEHDELILQRNRQLMESIWQQNQQCVSSKSWAWSTTPEK